LPGDTLHSDPLLLALADNGGPTLTHALAPASPARDAGNNAANLSTDQRGAGHPRVAGAAADIGAFEAGFVVQAVPLAVPALSMWVIGVLAGLLAWLGLRQVRADARRGTSAKASRAKAGCANTQHRNRSLRRSK
jgi:beta-lactamase regulating signal transducer with metallopeptidase domain